VKEEGVWERQHAISQSRGHSVYGSASTIETLFLQRTLTIEKLLPKPYRMGYREKDKQRATVVLEAPPGAPWQLVPRSLEGPLKNGGE